MVNDNFRLKTPSGAESLVKPQKPMVSRAAFTRVQSLPEASPTMKNPELSSFLAYNSSRLAFTWSPEPSILTQFKSEMALVQLTKVKNKSCSAGAPE